MATFTWSADYGASKTSKPTVSQIKFGDGYESRVAHGINTNLKSWSLSFRYRDDDEAQEIEDFLDARGGTESFDWTPPGADDSSKYVCREWSRTIDHFNGNTITAMFEEVGEP